MRLNNRTRLSVEALNDRIAPATFATSHVGGTLVITQTAAAVGTILIADNPGAGTFTIDDIADANPATVVPTAGFPNLVVKLKAADAVPVLYDIQSARAGNVTLSVKNAGARTLGLDGGFTIGGNLRVIGGDGSLSVLESVNPLLVGGNATFVGGASSDSLSLGGLAGSSIGGNLATSRFNTVVTSAGDSVGGNVSFNDAGEATPNVLSLPDTQVGGSLRYTGGTRGDTISLGGVAPTVGGDVIIKFGSQLPADGSVFVQAAGLTSIIGGRVRVVGSSLGTDTVVLNGVVNGDVGLKMGGGTNTAVMGATFLGPVFRYTGGAGTDVVVYNTLAGSVAARLDVRLGAGADTMSFGGASVDPSFAYVDFGAGIDTLGGTIDFSATFVNLP